VLRYLKTAIQQSDSS